MRLKAKSYLSKKRLFLVAQLCVITTLHGAEVLRGVGTSDDFLSIQPQQARIESDGAELRSGTETKITFTRPNGQINFNAPEDPWDFSRHVAVAIDIENIGNGPVTLLGVLNHFGWNEGFLHLEAGEKGTMLLFLTRKREDETPWMKAHFEKMRGMPGGQIMFRAGVDPAGIECITVGDLDGVSVGQTIRIHQIRGVARFGKLSGVSEADFFPFVDRFGQYAHEDWPGKIHSVEDLKANLAAEKADLSNCPAPEGRSRYGGWVNGPRLKATGHFRTTKYEGKWWLVDPDGFLFWSHGMACVGVGGGRTRIEGHEHYFEQLPEGFTDEKQAAFGAANQALKYGDDWEVAFRRHTLRRLKSWGINTLGNWSERETYLQDKMPYVVAIHYGGEPEDLMERPDELRTLLRQRMQKEVGTTSDDPWCIGYFVDNEIKWTADMDAELYYRIVSEEVKRAAPNKLYLGSRFHEHNNPYGTKPFVMRAAARYCDVIGINRYCYSPGDLKMLEGVDVPVIIGEFHFGALDRGQLHPGLRGVVNQKQRGLLYTHYVTTALKHPNIVGTHYFQYREQSLTGRGDGENYQIGFVDIADTPYTEMVDAARQVGNNLYQIRFEGKSD